MDMLHKCLFHEDRGNRRGMRARRRVAGARETFEMRAERKNKKHRRSATASEQRGIMFLTTVLDVWGVCLGCGVGLGESLDGADLFGLSHSQNDI